MLSNNKSLRLTAAAFLLAFAGAALSACSYPEEHDKTENLSFSVPAEEESVRTQETFAVPSAEAEMEQLDFIPRLDGLFGKNVSISDDSSVTEDYGEKQTLGSDSSLDSDITANILVKYPFSSTTDPDSSNITAEDINTCIALAGEIASEMFAQPIIEANVCDIDFDGQDEVLMFMMTGAKEIYVYEKADGEMVRSSNFGLGQLNKVSSLELHPYISENESEKYAYFVFHYDNEGAMDCDVLATIKQSDGEYYIDFLLSWGTLSYTENGKTFSKDFYRIGWGNGAGYVDINPDKDYNDISYDEFLEIYGKYTALKPLT